MSLRTLIVDDSAMMRAMLKKALKVGRIPVGEEFIASNGREALELLRDETIDLALVDLNMPVMDGLTLLEEMRADEALVDIATIVISTEGSKPRIERVRDLGADFLRKPFTPEQLREIVLRVTGVEDELEQVAAGHGDADF